jgi:hypothetical protein
MLGGAVKPRLLVVVSVLLLTLAGCGGSEDSGLPERTASATESAANGDLSIEPGVKPERPEDVRSEDGAVAFSGYAMQMVVYGLSTNDVDPFLALAAGPECKGCVNFAQATADRGDVVQTPSGPTTIGGFETQKGSDTEYLVTQVMSIPKGKDVNEKTDEVTDTYGPTEFEIRAKVVWEDQKWKLSNYSSEKVVS